MNKINLPSELSYSVIVHGGSYNDFLHKLSVNYPFLEIAESKIENKHYHVITLREKKGANYKKEDLYKLPIIALREEFSNYMFFKNERAYKNTLRFMCLETKEACDKKAFLLFAKTLTVLEKIIFSDITEDTKKIDCISYINEIEANTIIADPSTINDNIGIREDIFKTQTMKVDGILYNFVDLMSKQTLNVGILKI